MYDPIQTAQRKLLANHILTLLGEAQFVEYPGQSEREFYREVEETPRTRVQVYSSITGYDDRAQMRLLAKKQRGKPALDPQIRVAALFRCRGGSEDRVIVPEVQIPLVGTYEDIYGKMLVVMRETYKAAGMVPLCAQCGVPTYVAKSQKRVCADWCWKK